MVNRVVMTKLTEEEHSKLLDVCNREGCTSSHLIRDAIMKRIDSQEKSTEKELRPTQKLAKELRIKSQGEKIDEDN